jgi:hypothetical protein
MIDILRYLNIVWKRFADRSFRTNLKKYPADEDDDTPNTM